MSEKRNGSDHEDLVAKLQANVNNIWQPYFSDPMYMEKWLKARDYDLKKAELMLRNHIAWRQKENIDTILKDFPFPEVYEKFGLGGYCGHDKEGRPVCYEMLGNLDPQGILKSLTVSDLLKTRIRLLEELFQNIFPKRSAEEGRTINQIVSLIDLEGFGRKNLWRPSMECAIEMLKIMEGNYPEFMNKILIFNSPPIFRIAFNIIQPFLHKATRNKICFLGKNFKEELLKVINADQLPAYYGGNMYGPNDDPMCRHLIRWGGEVPPSYYLNKHTQEMVNITVNARSKVKLSYYIGQPDSVLFYEFSTKDHDINFGIYYLGEELSKHFDKIKSSSLECVLLLNRSHNHVKVQKGEIGSLKLGYYLIEFDNGYSWTKSKNVQYHIQVLDIMKE